VPLYCLVPCKQKITITHNAFTAALRNQTASVQLTYTLGPERRTFVRDLTSSLGMGATNEISSATYKVT